MEAAVAGTLYAVETVAEGAAGLYAGLTMKTAPLTTTFQRLKAPSLPRSSHSLSVVKGRAYIFGGEITPRTPVDNAMHIITLPSTGSLQEADYVSVPAQPTVAGGPVPAPRVGHASAAIGDIVYVFGGRGGKDMAALPEDGKVWAFDTRTKTWSSLDPTAGAVVPDARSYHAMTATERPLPTAPPNVANVLIGDGPDSTQDLPEPPAPNSFGTLFVHAGCLSGGGRTGDLWAFDVSSRSWAAMPHAPGAARGGPSLAIVKDRIYRFGGFDGQHELGGQVDWLNLQSGSFDDKSGRGEMAVSAAPDGWHSDVFAIGSEHGVSGSGLSNRSVAGMVPLSTGQGRNYLVVFCGETTPSNKGHEGAGRFLDDAWTFQLKPEGATAASVKDATRGVLMGKETGEKQVKEVRYKDADGKLIQESQPKPMGARGWFACDGLGDAGGEAPGFVVWGGIDESNERLGDGWLVTFE